MIDMQFELQAKVIDEAGYLPAMKGIILNKGAAEGVVKNVSKILCEKDFGHNKFLEQIVIWIEVRAPRYWWQEADTYRISSKQSQSTMNTLLKRGLTCYDFECTDVRGIDIEYLNALLRERKLVELKRKLPEGFMQKRIWCMSYKTLRNIILQRREHRLPHWRLFLSEILLQVKHPELLPKLS